MASVSCASNFVARMTVAPQNIPKKQQTNGAALFSGIGTSATSLADRCQACCSTRLTWPRCAKAMTFGWPAEPLEEQISQEGARPQAKSCSFVLDCKSSIDDTV